MTFHAYRDDQIARRTAVTPVAPLAPKRDTLAIVDTRRNRYPQLFHNLDKACSTTITTGIFNNFTGSATRITGNGGLELHAAHALYHSSLPASAADRTGFGTGSLCGTAARTVGALLDAVIGHILLDAECCFFKSDGNRSTDIISASGAISSGIRCAAKATAENITENISQIAEAAESAKAIEPTCACTALFKGGMTELVVLRTLLRIRKDSIRLVYFLKFDLGFFVARIHIGVIFLGKTAVSLFYGSLVRVLIYAEDLIIVSFFCHI